MTVKELREEFITEKCHTCTYRLGFRKRTCEEYYICNNYLKWLEQKLIRGPTRKTNEVHNLRY